VYFPSNKDKYINIAINLEVTATGNRETYTVNLWIEGVRAVTQKMILCKTKQAIKTTQKIKITH